MLHVSTALWTAVAFFALAPLGPVAVAPPRARRALVWLAYLWPLTFVCRALGGDAWVLPFRRQLGLAILEFEPIALSRPNEADPGADPEGDDDHE
jgi:hypothetical protein